MVKHLRRSTRHGRRRSTRIKPKKIRRKKIVKEERDLYDRDLGGYKFVCAHKDNKWHLTKRSRQQQDQEKLLCDKMKKDADAIDDEGYAIDSFFVAEDTGETTLAEETDELFAKAAAIENVSSSEDEDEEWSENENDKMF